MFPHLSKADDVKVIAALSVGHDHHLAVQPANRIGFRTGKRSKSTCPRWTRSAGREQSGGCRWFGPRRKGPPARCRGSRPRQVRSPAYGTGPRLTATHCGECSVGRRSGGGAAGRTGGAMPAQSGAGHGSGSSQAPRQSLDPCTRTARRSRPRCDRIRPLDEDRCAAPRPLTSRTRSAP
jgi:hypothetical protein